MKTDNKLPQPLTEAEYKEAESITREFYAKEIEENQAVEFPISEIDQIRQPKLRRLNELLMQQHNFMNWVHRSQRWN